MKKVSTLLSAMLLGGAMFANAADDLVVSYTYVPDSPITIESWASKEQEIPSVAFKNSVTPESTLRFYFEGTKAGSQIQLIYKADDSSWTWTEIAKYLDITGATLDYKLSTALTDEDSMVTDMDDMLAGLKAHGLYLKGEAYTVTKMEVLNPSGSAPEDPMANYELASTYTFDEPIPLAGWAEEMISSEPFEQLTEKSFVKFIFTDCTANPQIQLAYKSGAGNTWTQLSEYENVEANIFMLSMASWKSAADAAEWIAKRGIWIKGQNCSLSAIEVYNVKGEGPKDPNEGMVVCQTYTLDPALVADAWNNEMNIPSAAFKHLFDQSVIRLVFEKAEAEAQLQFVCKMGANWTWTELVQNADITGKTWEYNVADADDPEAVVECLRARGAILKGQNFKLVQVITLNPEGVDPNPEVEMEVVETYDCNETIATWDDEPFNVPASVFEKVSEKSTIVLSFTNCDKGQAQIAYKADDAEGTWTQYQDYTEIEAGKITIGMNEFKNPAGAVASLKKEGMFVKGHDFTLVKVEVLNPKNVSGVENIFGNEASAEIDWNAPVEIYTISGARVSEMSKGNVYIVRQGSVAKKIAM